MTNITIDPEFQSYIPRPSEQERALLEQSILKEGCRDPLVVWASPEDDEELILLDGHNRYEICRANNIEFYHEVLDLQSREQALSWIIDNQLGRRNLTPEQMHYFRGQRYNLEKAGISNPAGNNQHSEVDRQTEDQPPTHERLAQVYKVSPSTIERDARFATAVDTLASNAGPDARQKILNSQTGLTRGDVQLVVNHLTPDEQHDLLEQGKPRIKEEIKKLKQEDKPSHAAKEPQIEEVEESHEEQQVPREEDTQVNQENTDPEEPAEAAEPAATCPPQCRAECKDLVDGLTKYPELAAKILGTFYDREFLSKLVEQLKIILNRGNKEAA